MRDLFDRFAFYNYTIINQKITSEANLKKYIFILNGKCLFFFEKDSCFS